MSWSKFLQVKIGSFTPIALGLLSAVLLFFLWEGLPHAQTDDYYPGATVRILNGKFFKPQRSLTDDQSGATKFGLAVGNRLYTVAFDHTFVSFDQKQNLQLWLVIATRRVRSPPAQIVA